jgi:hypothetical protein
MSLKQSGNIDGGAKKYISRIDHAIFPKHEPTTVQPNVFNPKDLPWLK